MRGEEGAQPLSPGQGPGRLFARCPRKGTLGFPLHLRWRQPSGPALSGRARTTRTSPLRACRSRSRHTGGSPAWRRALAHPDPSMASPHPRRCGSGGPAPAGSPSCAGPDSPQFTQDHRIPSLSAHSPLTMSPFTGSPPCGRRCRRDDAPATRAAPGRADSSGSRPGSAPGGRRRSPVDRRVAHRKAT